MPFVELNNDKVIWTEEGLVQKEVRELQTISCSIDDEFFNDVATYIYWAYKKDGLYDSELPNIKKDTVCRRHFNNRKWEDFEDIQQVRDIIKLYINLSYTVTEKMYIKLKKDIDDLFIHLSDIPLIKKLKVKVPITGEDGEITNIEKIVEFSNFEEKSKAMKQANDIIAYEESLKLKIFKESKDKIKSKRIFDTT